MGATVAGAAALVAAAFAVALLRRWQLRGRSNRALVLWSVSLGMFAVASAALAYGELAGWSSGWFRVFYAFGGVLVVPWLALGTVQTAIRDPVTLRVLGVTALTVALLFLVPLFTTDTTALYVPAVVLGVLWGLLLVTAPPEGVGAGSTALIGTFTAVALFAVAAGTLQAALPVDGVPEGRALFAPGIRGLAVGGNAVGATMVVVGAVTSAWRLRGQGTPHLVVGNLLIGVGVLIAASGGTLAFLGDTALHAVAFAVGVTVMYAGFTRTTRVPGQVPRAVQDGARR